MPVLSKPPIPSLPERIPVPLDGGFAPATVSSNRYLQFAISNPDMRQFSLGFFWRIHPTYSTQWVQPVVFNSNYVMEYQLPVGSTGYVQLYWNSDSARITLTSSEYDTGDLFYTFVSHITGTGVNTLWNLTKGWVKEATHGSVTIGTAVTTITLGTLTGGSYTPGMMYNFKMWHNQSGKHTREWAEQEMRSFEPVRQNNLVAWYPLSKHYGPNSGLNGRPALTTGGSTAYTYNGLPTTFTIEQNLGYDGLIMRPPFRRMMNFDVPHETKPDGVDLEIDWSNPLTRGIKFAIPFDEGGGQPREIITGSLIDAGANTVAWRYSNKGKMLGKTTKVADYKDHNAWSRNSGNEGSLAVIAQYNGLSGQEEAIVWYRQDNSKGFKLLINQYDGTTAQMRFYTHWNDAGLSINQNVGAYSKVFALSGSNGPNNGIELYYEGRRIGSGAQQTTESNTTTATHRVEYGYGSGVNNCIQGRLLAVGWDREITPAEHAAFANNPWQIFKPKRQHIIIPREHLIETNITRTSQPPEGMIDIDFNNPINKDLAFAYTPQSHIGREHTSGSFAYWPVAAASSATGAPQVTATKFGRALHGIDNVSTEGGLHWNTNASYNVQGSYITAMLLFRPNSNTWDTYNSSIFNSKKVGGFSGWSFGATRSSFTNKFVWMCRDATSSINVDLNSVRLSTLDLQKQYCMIGVYDNGPMRTYMNGIADIANESTGLSGPLYNGAYYPIGIWSEGTNYDHLQDSMDILLAAVWNRVLSPQEIAYISANPWQIFAPEKVFIPTNYEPYLMPIGIPRGGRPE